MAVNRHPLNIAKQPISENSIPENYASTRTQFPKAALFFRQFSKICVPKYRNKISEIPERCFRNNGQFFRNISESFLKIFSRNSAPVKEISETEVYMVYVVIVRNSA